MIKGPISTGVPMKYAILALTLIITSSCASKGFKKDVLRQELRTGEPRQVTDEEIRKVFELRPQLPKPFKIGVYFADNKLRNWDLRWNSEDKEVILQLEEELKKTGEVSQMFLINESLVQGHDIKSLRLAAAHHGADALLVISSTHDTDRYLNNWGGTYILIVPSFFVPGTVTDALYITRAALWDVRNEYLYMAVESESFKRKVSPAFSADMNEQLLKAKRDSVMGLKKEILRMAENIKK